MNTSFFRLLMSLCVLNPIRGGIMENLDLLTFIISVCGSGQREYDPASRQIVTDA